jgi:hypothetical protein
LTLINKITPARRSRKLREILKKAKRKNRKGLRTLRKRKIIVRIALMEWFIKATSRKRRRKIKMIKIRTKIKVLKIQKKTRKIFRKRERNHQLSIWKNK